MIGVVENKTFVYERAFSEIKRLSSAGLEGTELLRRTAEALRPAVPFGSYCVATIDPASNLITDIFNGGSAGEDGHAEVYGEVLHRTYFEEDLGRIASMLHRRSPAQPLSEAAGALDRSLRYREYLGPAGFGHELAGLFVDSGVWGAGYLTRERGEPDFTSGEISLLARVAPHVGAGLKAAALRSRATEGPPGPGVPGVIVLDRKAPCSLTPRPLNGCSRRSRTFVRDGRGTASPSPSRWQPGPSVGRSTLSRTGTGILFPEYASGGARGVG